MTEQLPLPTTEQQTIEPNIEATRGSSPTLRHKMGRLAVAGMLVVTGTAFVDIADSAPAYANSIDIALANYPNKDMPCEHAPYNVTGLCANYDWGPKHTESYDDQSEKSSRGFAYRNCTDWVAYRLLQVAGYAANPSLGNGGDWYTHASASQKSSTPAAWDAAVEPAVYNAQGKETDYGHVAFIESVNSVDPTNPLNDNITVSEYNHDWAGNGDQRTGTALSMGFTEFVDFGVHPGGGGSSSQRKTDIVAFESNGTEAAQPRKGATATNPITGVIAAHGDDAALDSAAPWTSTPSSPATAVSGTGSNG